MPPLIEWEDVLWNTTAFDLLANYDITSSEIPGFSPEQPMPPQHPQDRPTVSRRFLDTLHSYGITKVFLVPGAHITPLIVELEKHGVIDPVVASHELAAAYMAIGYARASGRPGAVFSIGGPGTAYMMGAAITAKADNVPVIFISGDIPEKHQGKREFQDSGPAGTNDCGIYREAIGESHVCASPDDLQAILERVSSRINDKLPIHVRVPIDVQRTTCLPLAHPARTGTSPFHPVDPPGLATQKRIVLLVGHFAVGHLSQTNLLEYVKANNLAVVTEISARGVIPEDSPHCLGYIGFHSDSRALDALNSRSGKSADIVVSLGARPETLRQYVSGDIRVLETSAFEIPAPADDTCLRSTTRETLDLRSSWLESFPRTEQNIPGPRDDENFVSHRTLFRELSEQLPGHTRYCLDAGQARKTGNMLLSCTEPNTIIQSESLSPMGFGLCASIGAKLANPDTTVVSLVGDGSMRMHGMEIATAARYQIPIIFILLDNESYASLLSREHMESYAALPECDWSAFAKSQGVPCIKANSDTEFKQALDTCLKAGGPALLWTKTAKNIDAPLRMTQKLEYVNWLAAVNKA